jgi:hypothetical protein
MRQALHETGGDRISAAKGNDYGNSGCLGCKRRPIADCDDHIDAGRSHFVDDAGNIGELSLGATSREAEVFPDRVAMLFQGTNERSAVRSFLIACRSGAKGADMVDFAGLSDGCTGDRDHRSRQQLYKMPASHVSTPC